MVMVCTMYPPSDAVPAQGTPFGHCRLSERSHRKSASYNNNSCIHTYTHIMHDLSLSLSLSLYIYIYIYMYVYIYIYVCISIHIWI